MLEEYAAVIGLETNHNQEYVQLEIIRKTPCTLCGKTRGCGVSMWGKIFKHGQKPLRLQNTIQAKIGDHVVIGIQEQAFLKNTMYLYGVPLFSMLLGATLSAYWLAAGKNVATTDWYTLCGAIAGLIIGYLWLKAHQAGVSYQAGCLTTLLRIMPQSGQEQAIFMCERSQS